MWPIRTTGRTEVVQAGTCR